MKSFTAVYNKSKREVTARREQIFESQKVAIINVLKEEYMITGKISELPVKDKEMMAERLKQYWSPKNGINEAGVKLLNENMITLSPNSSKEDIKLYIVKQTKKNLMQITECFRSNRVDVIVESFNEEIQPMINKKLKEKFIINTVWEIVEDRIKHGL